MDIFTHSLEGIEISKGNALNKNLSQKIKEDILDGKLKRGDKLTEQEICQKYSVSRTPVREAYFQLESEGLLEIIPNRGAFVIGLSDQDRIDIHKLRCIYEVQATEWAIDRITETQLEKLGETFEFMEFYTAKKDYNKMITINSLFHQVIYQSSQNKLLQHVLSLFQSYVGHNHNAERATEYLEEILEEHRQVYLAFLEKNATKGAEAMQRHIENSAERKTKSQNIV